MGKDKEFDTKRMIESQNMIQAAMNKAFGLYIAKEPKHGDEWRDKTSWQNFKHLEHEIAEIQRSKKLDREIHNGLDACAQAAIFTATLINSTETIDESLYMKHGGK